MTRTERRRVEWAIRKAAELGRRQGPQPAPGEPPPQEPAGHEHIPPAVALAMLDHVIECREWGDDPEPGLAALRRLMDDPREMARVTGTPRTVTKAAWFAMVLKDKLGSQPKRPEGTVYQGKKGKWFVVRNGRNQWAPKEMIPGLQAGEVPSGSSPVAGPDAGSPPAAAPAPGANPGVQSRATPASVARAAAATRPQSRGQALAGKKTPAELAGMSAGDRQAHAVARVAELTKKVQAVGHGKGAFTGEDLHELSSHLPHLTHQGLRSLRSTLQGSLGGHHGAFGAVRSKAGRVSALQDHFAKVADARAKLADHARTASAVAKTSTPATPAGGAGGAGSPTPVSAASAAPSAAPPAAKTRQPKSASPSAAKTSGASASQDASAGAAAPPPPPPPPAPPSAEPPGDDDEDVFTYENPPVPGPKPAAVATGAKPPASSAPVPAPKMAAKPGPSAPPPKTSPKAPAATPAPVSPPASPPPPPPAPFEEVTGGGGHVAKAVKDYATPDEAQEGLKANRSAMTTVRSRHGGKVPPASHPDRAKYEALQDRHAALKDHHHQLVWNRGKDRAEGIGRAQKAQGNAQTWAANLPDERRAEVDALGKRAAAGEKVERPHWLHELEYDHFAARVNAVARNTPAGAKRPTPAPPASPVAAPVSPPAAMGDDDEADRVGWDPVKPATGTASVPLAPPSGTTRVPPKAKAPAAPAPAPASDVLGDVEGEPFEPVLTTPLSPPEPEPAPAPPKEPHEYDHPADVRVEIESQRAAMQALQTKHGRGGPPVGHADRAAWEALSSRRAALQGRHAELMASARAAIDAAPLSAVHKQAAHAALQSAVTRDDHDRVMAAIGGAPPPAVAKPTGGLNPPVSAAPAPQPGTPAETAAEMKEGFGNLDPQQLKDSAADRARELAARIKGGEDRRKVMEGQGPAMRTSVARAMGEEPHPADAWASGLPPQQQAEVIKAVNKAAGGGVVTTPDWLRPEDVPHFEHLTESARPAPVQPPPAGDPDVPAPPAGAKVPVKPPVPQQPVSTGEPAPGDDVGRKVRPIGGATTQPGETSGTSASRDASRGAVHSEAHGRLRDAIDSSAGISDEQRTKYHAGIDRVAGAMSKGAHERVGKHLKTATFHPDVAAVGRALRDRMTPEDRARLDAGQLRPGGAYVRRDGELHADGDRTVEDVGRHAGQFGDTHHTYAHELGHAIDGPDHELSGSADWRAAFGREIDADHNPLTRYARKKPSEGFAEFARLVYASDVPHAQIEAEFPLASAFFKKQGLWPENERTGDAAKMPEAFDTRVELEGGGHLDAKSAATPATPPTPQPSQYAADRVRAVEEQARRVAGSPAVAPAETADTRLERLGDKDRSSVANIHEAAGKVGGASLAEKVKGTPKRADKVALIRDHLAGRPDRDDVEFMLGGAGPADGQDERVRGNTERFAGAYHGHDDPAERARRYAELAKHPYGHPEAIDEEHIDEDTQDQMTSDLADLPHAELAAHVLHVSGHSSPGHPMFDMAMRAAGHKARQSPPPSDGWGRFAEPEAVFHNDHHVLHTDDYSDDEWAGIQNAAKLLPGVSRDLRIDHGWAMAVADGSPLHEALQAHHGDQYKSREFADDDSGGVQAIFDAGKDGLQVGQADVPASAKNYGTTAGALNPDQVDDQSWNPHAVDVYRRVHPEWYAVRRSDATKNGQFEMVHRSEVPPLARLPQAYWKTFDSDPIHDEDLAARNQTREDKRPQVFSEHERRGDRGEVLARRGSKSNAQSLRAMKAEVRDHIKRANLAKQAWHEALAGIPQEERPDEPDWEGTDESGTAFHEADPFTARYDDPVEHNDAVFDLRRQSQAHADEMEAAVEEARRHAAGWHAKNAPKARKQLKAAARLMTPAQKARSVLDVMGFGHGHLSDEQAEAFLRRVAALHAESAPPPR